MGTVTTTFYFDGPTPSGGLGQWAGADVLIDVEPWVATYGPNDEVSQTIRITEWPIFRGLKRDGGNWHFDTEFGLVDANLVWEVTLEGPETTINRTYTNTLSSAFDQAQINTSATNPWLMQIWLWHTQSGGTIDGVTVPSPEGIMLLPFVPEPSSGLLLLYAVLPLAAAHIREPRPRPA